MVSKQFSCTDNTYFMEPRVCTYVDSWATATTAIAMQHNNIQFSCVFNPI